MYLSAFDIANLPGALGVHFLNPGAVRLDKSLGDATGLRNLGVHLVTVDPGYRSTELHVHHFEEECIYLLSGRGTAIIGDRIIPVQAGDFIGCPANGIAHELVNDGTEPLVFLVVGQRLEHDVTDFPRQRKRLYRLLHESNLVDFDHLDSSGQVAVEPEPVVLAAPGNHALRLIPIDPEGKPVGVTERLPREAVEACAASAELYGLVGYVPPWIGYLAFLGEECVGTCTFKSPPRGKSVEIAYYAFPHATSGDHATGMASALMRIAFEAQPGIRLLVHTPAEEDSSTAVLSTLGFHLAGRGHDADEGEVWEWVLQTAAS